MKFLVLLVPLLKLIWSLVWLTLQRLKEFVLPKKWVVSFLIILISLPPVVMNVRCALSIVGDQEHVTFVMYLVTLVSVVPVRSNLAHKKKRNYQDTNKRSKVPMQPKQMYREKVKVLESVFENGSTSGLINHEVPMYCVPKARECALVPLCPSTSVDVPSQWAILPSYTGSTKMIIDDSSFAEADTETPSEIDVVNTVSVTLCVDVGSISEVIEIMNARNFDFSAATEIMDADVDVDVHVPCDSVSGTVNVPLAIMESNDGLVSEFIINHYSKPLFYVDVKNRSEALSGIENAEDDKFLVIGNCAPPKIKVGLRLDLFGGKHPISLKKWTKVESKK